MSKWTRLKQDDKVGRCGLSHVIWTKSIFVEGAIDQTRPLERYFTLPAEFMGNLEGKRCYPSQISRYCYETEFRRTCKNSDILHLQQVDMNAHESLKVMLILCSVYLISKVILLILFWWLLLNASESRVKNIHVPSSMPLCLYLRLR